ncbi:sugar transporter ERD6-like 8 [Miscanthus floridulus]|uniref:sugar transporter ERD6-like 8 n=1 Tax=Miscanthus floridulus TaxID=154761 RepID=UPI003457AFC4
MEREGRDAAEKPLLVRVVGSGSGDSQGGSGSSSSVAVVVGCTAIAVTGSFEFGVSISYSSPTRLGIMRDLHLSLAEYSVFGSILTIGAVLCAIVCGSIAGRRGAMAISDVLCALGYLGFSQVLLNPHLSRMYHFAY